jgi:hypothetical protein
LVLFAEVEGKNPSFLHFSHGGFSYDISTKTLLHSPGALLKDKNAMFELIPSLQAQGYMWSDFYQCKYSKPNSRGFANASDGVATLGKMAVRQYHLEIAQQPNMLLKAIFRGHQDSAFGVKMLFENEPSFEELQKFSDNNSVYPQGPYYWKDVVKDPQKITNARNIGLSISDYEPIFTFTTAAEGRGLPFDSFGIIKTLDYKLLIHEIALHRRTLNRSYLNIKASEATDDNIDLNWSKTGPGRILLEDYN